MRQKRKCHENIIVKNKAREYTEENISLFKQNMYSIQTDIFKKDGGDEEEEGGQSGNEEDGSDAEEELNDDYGLEAKTLNGNSTMEFDNEEFSITITGNDEAEDEIESSGNKKGVKRKKGGVSKKAMKRMKQVDVIDKENFIPYKPKNFHTDKGYIFVGHTSQKTEPVIFICFI